MTTSSAGHKPKRLGRGVALRLAAAVTALACLAGCESAAQIRQRDATRCAGYGFKPGTDAFANCLQQENLARQYRLDQMQMWSPPAPYGYWWWGPPPPPR
jgi:hypothetical protein